MNPQPPRDPAITYEEDLENIEGQRRINKHYFLKEEKIIQKYRDAREGGAHSKDELSSITKQYDEELKDIRERIEKTSAKIVKTEKKIQEYSDKPKHPT